MKLTKIAIATSHTYKCTAHRRFYQIWFRTHIATCRGVAAHRKSCFDSYVSSSILIYRQLASRTLTVAPSIFHNGTKICMTSHLNFLNSMISQIIMKVSKICREIPKYVERTLERHWQLTRLYSMVLGQNWYDMLPE